MVSEILPPPKSYEKEKGDSLCNHSLLYSHCNHNNATGFFLKKNNNLKLLYFKNAHQKMLAYTLRSNIQLAFSKRSQNKPQ